MPDFWNGLIDRELHSLFLNRSAVVIFSSSSFCDSRVCVCVYGVKLSKGGKNNKIFSFLCLNFVLLCLLVSCPADSGLGSDGHRVSSGRKE